MYLYYFYLGVCRLKEIYPLLKKIINILLHRKTIINKYKINKLHVTKTIQKQYR